MRNPIWKWFLTGKYFWSFILLLILLIFVYYLNLNIVGYWIGFLLPILGSLIVIKGINDKVTGIKGHNLKIELIQYLKSFPRKQKHHRMEVEPARFNITGNKIFFITKISDDADLPSKVEHCLKEINRLTLAHNQLVCDIDAEQNRINSLMDNFDSKVKEDHHQLQNLIESTTIGNYDLELFGVLCIVLGLLIASVPSFVYVKCCF